MSEWIVPFRGRGHSTAVNLNFLWREEQVYVMDNHRAALWCWLRHLKAGSRAGLLHVDRHTDAARVEKDIAALAGADPEAMDIAAYLDAGWESEFFTVTPLFRWDNYLTLFLERYADRLDGLYLATHGQGKAPEGVEHWDVHPWHLPGGPVFRGAANWVVNWDLDYFMYKRTSGERARLFSESFLRDALAPVKSLREAGRLACLTLCLSPECCGGWSEAEKLLAVACEALGLTFELPAEPA